MKNTKRILSLAAAVAMTMQTGIALPAYAEEEAESAQKIGLIYENDGTSGWKTGYDFIDNTTQKATFTYETDETNKRAYLHFTPSGTNTGNYLATPMIYASLGDDKIQFKKGYTIVTEMLVRTNTVDTLNVGRTRINYGFPETSSLNAFTYINEGTKDGQTQTKYTPGMCSEVLTEFFTYKKEGSGEQVKDIRFGLGTYPIGDYTEAAKLSKDNWYKILIKINGEHYAEYTLFDEQGTKLTEIEGDRLIKPESGYFENIALTTWINMKPEEVEKLTEGASYTDIDYVKVYNVPDSAADNYTYFTDAQEETVISNVKVDGVALDDVFEATNGTVTFDSNNPVNNAEVYYEINGAKTTLTQDTDFTISDNTLSFANGLVKNAAYTVNLDLGYAKYPITFDSVYEQKVGLIYSQKAETAHDETNPAWTNNEYFGREATDTGMKYTSVDNKFEEEKIGRVEMPLGDKKIKFKNGQTIVIESQLKIDKGTGKARVGLYYNTESTVKDPDTTQDALKNIEQKSTFSSNHSFIAGLFDTSEYSDKMQVIYPNGVPGYIGTGNDNRHQTNIQWPGDKNDYVTGYSLDGNTAYKMVVWLDVLGNKLTYALYCGETKIREYTTNDLGWVTTSDFLTSLRFANMANPAKSIELDYVKIYNIPTEAAANYSDFTQAFDEWTITDKAVKLEDKTVTFGGVPEGATFTVTSIDAQKVSDTPAAVENFNTSYQNGTTTITFEELPKNKIYTVKVTYGYSRSFEFETVYDGKTGVIKKADEISDFENLWPNYGTMSKVTDEDGTTWTRLTNKIARTDYALPSVSVSLGDERIKAESDKLIRVKARVRAKAKANSASNASYSRVNMYANLSESLSGKKVTYTDDTTSVEQKFLFGHNHALLWVLEGYSNKKGKHGYVNGNHPDNNSKIPAQSKQQFATESNLPVFDGTKAITVTMDLDMLENKARFIYEYDGMVFVEESTNLGFTAFDGWLNNIVIGSFGALADCDYFDVDYVEISNIKKSDRALTVNVEDGKVTLTTARTDAELSDVGATLYAASYDSTGALTGVKSAAAVNGAKIEITGDNIRTFLWNKDMQPIE